MAEPAHSFDDGAAYERFMGRWSRTAGELFLDWLKPPVKARWLDVGCGTGALTGLIVQRCRPMEVQAIDPVPAQVAHARHQPAAQSVAFSVADAMSLPFAAGTFDIIVSALVLNFIRDRQKALAEMRRVARPGGVIASYVWDFSAELSPSGPFREGLRRFGLAVPDVPGTSASSLDALAAMFREAGGLTEIVTTSFDVTERFVDFDDFWQSQTPSYSPTTKMISKLSITDVERLKSSTRALLQAGRDGGVQYQARANAIQAQCSP